jgi:hypothetical protein
MRGLEVGLTVGDIATVGFDSCGVSDAAADVLASSGFSLYDAIPVRDDGRVVGVVERRESAALGQQVAAVMRRLDDSLLVSAQEPLKRFIPLLAATPYRLVVDDARILGIVTRSDVHKLPVRLLTFAIVTHLELLMAELITTSRPNDVWVEGLAPARRARFDEKRMQLRSANFDPPLIELTDFCDKRDLLLPLVRGRIGIGNNKAKTELRRIEELRNKVAHAAGFATDRDEFDRFVSTFESAEMWIRRLNECLTA